MDHNVLRVRKDSRPISVRYFSSESNTENFSHENTCRFYLTRNVNLDSCSKRDSRDTIGVGTTIKYITSFDWSIRDVRYNYDLSSEPKVASVSLR